MAETSKILCPNKRSSSASMRAGCSPRQFDHGWQCGSWIKQRYHGITGRDLLNTSRRCKSRRAIFAAHF